MPEAPAVPVAPVAPAAPPRLLFVDWLRGVAVLCMVVWHTMDAWTHPADRTSLAFDAIILIGGCAAPLFLFLAGVSVALSGQAMLARDRGPDSPRRPLAPLVATAVRPSRAAARLAKTEGPGFRSPRARVGWRLQKRGWQVFGLAHLFRLQSFLLNPAASWSSLLKPDILNILGLGIVAAGFGWSRATSRLRQLVWLIAPAAVIVMLAPASREWAWPALLRPYAPRLEAYIRPIGGMGVFGIFPWLAFVFVGTFVGMALARSGGAAGTQRRLALAGGAVLAGGVAGAYLPPIAPSEFWSTSLSYFLIRCGGMILGLSVGWLWLRRPGGVKAWSPLLVFGRESLFVYWVHVELAYGFFTYPLQRELPIGWALAAFAAFTAGMLGLTVLWMRRRRPLVPAYLRVA